MNKFWEKVLTAGGGISSKRLMGVACILFAMIFACLGLFLGDMGIVDGIVSTVIIEFLTAGVALFGITGWERKGSLYSTTNTSAQKDPEVIVANDEEMDENDIIKEKKTKRKSH